MDSHFCGIPYFIDHIQKRLAALTVEDVNRAIRKYLQTDDFSAVIITGEGKEVARRPAEASAPIAYQNPVPAEVTEMDRKIVVLPLDPAPSGSCRSRTPSLAAGGQRRRAIGYTCDRHGTTLGYHTQVRTTAGGSRVAGR